MSYQTYITEGIVCGSNPSNTSDRSFLIFTREAGMLFASARSVREERSKQRFALQDFSRIRVSLVKGKSGWRIGSVESLGNSFLRAETREERGRVSFVFTQIRRYVHGEVPLERVYDDVICMLEDQRSSASFEIARRVFMVRLLFVLGYIAPEPQWKEVVEAPELSSAIDHYDPSMEASMERTLSRASDASQL